MYISSLPIKMNRVLKKFSVCSSACSPPPAIFFWSTSGNFCVTWSITFWCLGKFRDLRERNEKTEVKSREGRQVMILKRREKKSRRRRGEAEKGGEQASRKQQRTMYQTWCFFLNDSVMLTTSTEE